MTGTRAALGVAFLLMSVFAYATSYSLPIDVSLMEDGRVRVCISSRFDRNGVGVELRSIAFDDPAVSPRERMWWLYAEEAGVSPVRCFNYGEIVGGLTQQMVPSPLQFDKIYRLTVTRPGEIGVINFIITKCGGRARLNIVAGK